MSDWAMIMAAGRGTRMGADRNKVLLPISGKPVLVYSLQAFVRANLRVALIVQPYEVQTMQSMLEENELSDAVQIFPCGGETRQMSVLGGLSALPEDTETVLIHDGARFLVSQALIERCLQSAREHGSGVAAIASRDSVHSTQDGSWAQSALLRDHLRLVQTPQAFHASSILKAHQMGMLESFQATDDAALYERYIGPVRLVEGEETNMKLTTKEDWRIVKAHLGRGMRIGQGVDVHRYVQGRPLILCGVTVPHTEGLLGHSDADVATHALMDALLGALAMGDIGKRYPDSDERFKGADSIELLKDVWSEISAEGWSLENADITIEAQKPKLAPHIQAMRESIARAMQVEVDRISVKATTTEELGFVGRLEGIRAQAVVLLQ